MPPVTLTRYQGEPKPPIWTEGGIPQWPDAQLFVGDKGMILTRGPFGSTRQQQKGCRIGRRFNHAGRIPLRDSRGLALLSRHGCPPRVASSSVAGTHAGDVPVAPAGTSGANLPRRRGL